MTGRSYSRTFSDIPRLILSLALLFIWPRLSLAEIKEYDFDLTASSNFVHYYSGYVNTPGSIDLNRVLLQSDGYSRHRLAKKQKDDDDGWDDDDGYDDDDKTEQAPPEDNNVDDDDYVDDDEVDDSPSEVPEDNAGTTKGGNPSTDITDMDSVDTSTTNKESVDTSTTSQQVASTATVVDIALFHEPSECARLRYGCDWTKLGIGKSDGFGNVRWCCSQATADLGLCNADSANEYGRLIIDDSIFKGQHRVITIPSSGPFSMSIPNPMIDVKEGSGKYILAFANCNDYGRDVNVVGPQEWKSVYGYLPGDLIDLWYFFIALMVMYIVLFLWYATSMRLHKDSSIGIQGYILSTIGLATLEMICRCTDYALWNRTAIRSYAAVFVWISFGVLKDAISRCLVLMVALGWGVIRDTLGGQLKKVIFLGIIYSVLSLAQEITGVIFVKDLYRTDSHHEEQLYDMYRVLDFFVQLVNVIFYYWILYALAGTMQYLSNMGQTRKLGRYLRLRFILLVSLLLAIINVIFGIAETNDVAIVPDNYLWLYDAAWEIIYALMLFSISILWRPNPSARDYAVAMEIPIGGDIEFDATIGHGFHDDDDEDEFSVEDENDSKKKTERTKLELS